MSTEQTSREFRNIVAGFHDPEAPLPPGLVWRTTPDGVRYVDYADQPDIRVPRQAHHETRVSGRAKDAALVAATGSAGIGAAATGIGWGLGMAGAHGEGLMQAAVALAVGTGSLAFLKTLLFPRRREPSVTTVTQHVTQNVVARPFGRATGGTATAHGVTKK